MALQHLLIMDKGSQEIIYSETYHSQAEYLCGLFRLVQDIAPFREKVKLAYIAPEPNIGRGQTKAFSQEDLDFILGMLPDKIKDAPDNIC